MYSNEEIQITELTETTGTEELINVCYTLYGYQRKGINAYYVIDGVKISSSEVRSPEDIERMFYKVYGCGYKEKVQRTSSDRLVAVPPSLIAPTVIALYANPGLVTTPPELLTVSLPAAITK